VPHKAGILVTHADVFLHLLFFHSVLSLDNNQLQLLSFTLWLRMLSCFARADVFSTIFSTALTQYLSHRATTSRVLVKFVQVSTVLD
jgi:hypothetical protein